MPRYSFPITTPKVMKSKVYDVPGTYTWTAPSGVTEVYITGCGAGGGGTFGTAGYPASAGGTTSFGSLLTLTGGGGAGYDNNYSNGGVGVGAGGSGGVGGAGGAGYGGGNSTATKSLATGPIYTGLKAAVGDGGSGDGGAGGGAGNYKKKYPVSVTPNASITVTIGAGGVGAATTNYKGGTGGDGLLIIEWWG